MREWHLITCEYPPQTGGVSDYTRHVATALAGDGTCVHVWCPASYAVASADAVGVSVHRELGSMSPKDLRRLGQELDRFPAPRRILVQWVPHGYGYRSMNVAFCTWLLGRSLLRGDRIELMVHEPGLGFGEGSWRQNLPAAAHRLMSVILLRSAKRVWISIPRWEKRLRPYCLGRQIPIQWLPIPSGIPVITDPSGVQEIRRRLKPPDGVVVGHFGTYGSALISCLEPVLLELEKRTFPHPVLLIGAGSSAYREQLMQRAPRLAASLHATGELSPEDVSRHLSACDVLLQPFPDGVSSRRTSVMAGISHGKAVVTNTGRSSEEIWATAGGVVLVDGTSAARFAEVVTALCADADTRHRVGAAGRQLYEERFTLSRTVSALQEIEVR